MAKGLLLCVLFFATKFELDAVRWGILLRRELNSGAHTHTVAEVNRKGRGERALEPGTQTADHCKVLNVGQTGSSPQRSLCPARRAPQNQRARPPQLNDVNVGVMFKLIVAAPVPLPHQRSSTVRNKSTVVRPPQGYLL